MMQVNKKRELLDFTIVKTEKSLGLKQYNTMVIKTGVDCTKDFLLKYAEKLFSEKLVSVRVLRSKPLDVYFKRHKGRTSAHKKFFLKFVGSKEVDLHY